MCFRGEISAGRNVFVLLRSCGPRSPPRIDLGGLCMEIGFNLIRSHDLEWSRRSAGDAAAQITKISHRRTGDRGRRGEKRHSSLRSSGDVRSTQHSTGEDLPVLDKGHIRPHSPIIIFGGKESDNPGKQSLVMILLEHYASPVSIITYPCHSRQIVFFSRNVFLHPPGLEPMLEPTKTAVPTSASPIVNRLTD